MKQLIQSIHACADYLHDVYDVPYCAVINVDDALTARILQLQKTISDLGVYSIDQFYQHNVEYYSLHPEEFNDVDDPTPNEMIREHETLVVTAHSFYFKFWPMNGADSEVISTLPFSINELV